MDNVQETQISYSPEQIDNLFDSLDSAWAASDYAKDLKDKADRTAKTLRKERSAVQEDIAEVNKSLWQEGVLPTLSPAECKALYDLRASLTTDINLAVKLAKCDGTTRRDYTEAAELFMADARAIREEIRGSPIKASKRLNPKILQRIITRRAKRNKSEQG